MIQKIKNKVIQEKCLRLEKKHRPKAIKNLDDIGIIIDLDEFENLSETEHVAQIFKSGSNKVETIAFSNNKNKREAFEGLIFDKKQITWKGGFKSGSDAEKFQQKPYDLLINYFVKAPPQVLLLSAAVQANLKVGLPSETNTTNDLAIAVKPTEISKFAKEVKTYLPKLNQ